MLKVALVSYLLASGLVPLSLTSQSVTIPDQILIMAHAVTGIPAHRHQKMKLLCNMGENHDEQTTEPRN